MLAANGVKVYLYPHLMPTPALSFAVLDRRCEGGVMVTASHNPARYNGYKAYAAAPSNTLTMPSLSATMPQ